MAWKWCGQKRREEKRTEPNRTEPNRTKQNRTKQNRTGQNRTEYIFKTEYIFDRCFTFLFPGFLILRPTPLLWQKEQERLTVELTTPHTASTVSAPERHKQQNERFSRKSDSVDSWQHGGNKGILVPLDFGLQLSGFGGHLVRTKRKTWHTEGQLRKYYLNVRITWQLKSEFVL